MDTLDAIPTLKTNRLNLSAFHINDKDAVYAYAKDPRIAATVTWDEHKGLMTEAAHQIIQWAFNTYPNLQRIQASCLPHNIGSRRVMEKSGMQFEGIRRSAMVVKGKVVDLAVYSIVRSDL